mgnify:CR=1 FL=1
MRVLVEWGGIHKLLMMPDIKIGMDEIQNQVQNLDRSFHHIFNTSILDKKYIHRSYGMYTEICKHFEFSQLSQ